MIPFGHVLSPNAVAALLVMGIAPATADAAPTVTATGDAGTPITLSPSAPTGIRQMDVSVGITVADDTFFQAQVLDGGGGAATPLSDCEDPGSLTGSPAYHGNGTYTVVVKYFGDADCGTLTSESRFQYAISAGAAVTPPPSKLLTRKPNSFVITTFPLGVTLNPGAISYEIRYKRNGVVQPDGSLGGTTQSAFVDTTSGLANFSFAKPGRYVIVARAAAGRLLLPWSAPTIVNAVAPFDLASVEFPDHKGPSYKLRGQIREHSRAARSRSTSPRARRRAGSTSSARRRSARRAASRSASRSATSAPTACATSTGATSTVAAGRVTERIKITRFFF